ncbi:MAG: hypothetical protein LBJ41_03720 [Treponema sp.]|jgi:cell shape-determining protein MreC|nr:hypothetical protein [Treponema sp.]
MYHLVPIVGAIAMFMGLPAVIFTFLYHSQKLKNQYKKKILELELEKQKNEIKLLEEENKKYDNIINNS